MSIVVAVQRDGMVALAADTLIVDSAADIMPGTVTGFSKILKAKDSWGYPCLVGVTGHLGHVGLLQEYLDSHDGKVAADSPLTLSQYYRGFWKFLQEEASCLFEDGNPTRNMGAGMTTVTRQGIFNTSMHLATVQHTRYVADGSGWRYALGALYVLDQSDILSAVRIATHACECAVVHDLYCGGEIECETIELLR